jgi:integrase
MLRADLDIAGIAYVDEAGRVFDFHAFRHTFITGLTRAGVHPKETQTLARHSTIGLTMDRYTHLGIVDAAQAAERLPAVPVVGAGERSGYAAANGLRRRRA